MRALLVEDDASVAKSIELMLKSENFNVYTTDLGEEGVDLGKLYDYDIILLDLNLPDMSGYEVLRSLRVSKVKTPILILSGLAGIEDKVKGLGFGADDYLTKPFHKDELVARIHAIVRRSKGHAQSVITTGDLVVIVAIRSERHTSAKTWGTSIDLRCCRPEPMASSVSFGWDNTMQEQQDKPEIIEHVAEIVSAYVGHNTLAPADLPALIGAVHQALSAATSPIVAEPAASDQAKAKPADIRRSLTADHLISFEDGKRYKSLKRHLTGRGLTPQAYREKWGLPADYPMVAPNYAAQRSALARSLGLGQKRKGRDNATTGAEPNVEMPDGVGESPDVVGEGAQADPALISVPAETEEAEAAPPAKRTRASKPKAKREKDAA